MRDIAPYFASTFLLISCHILYMYTGNMCLALWLMFIAVPTSNLITEGDNQNLAFKSEKVFIKDKRFWIPLWSYSIAETITWIWALIIFSDKVNIDLYWFQLKPTSYYEIFMFTYVCGYFSGVNTANGHELLHKKEWYNKYLGTWSYTKFMYSHFLDEHIKGHHKRIATPEDPA